MPDNKENIYLYQPLWGKWYIDLPIGKGSFGTVYKITREEMGSKYTSAVKLITVPSEEQYREAKASLGNDKDTLNGFFEDIVKNIINEINVLYSLSGNPNIITYQDHEMIKKKDSAEWDILIRMEYVTSLSKYLENNRMSLEQVIKLGMDICTALEACSKRGIIHRDIKDENIFINEDGVFKLGDFGIAKELSKTGRAASMRGTPLYMAPEVFKGEKYDAAVDIYSLGILLYKLLNYGRMPLMPEYPKPISFKDSENALERRVSGEPLPIPALAGEILGQAVLRACAYKPEERYSSPTEMKQALDQVLVSLSMEKRKEIVNPERVSETAAEKEKIQQPAGNETQNAGTIGIFETAENGKQGAGTIGIFNTTADSTGVSSIPEQSPEKPQNEQTVGIFGTADLRQQNAEPQYRENTGEGRQNQYPYQQNQPNTAYRYQQPQYNMQYQNGYYPNPRPLNARESGKGLFIARVILSGLIALGLLIAELSGFTSIIKIMWMEQAANTVLGVALLISLAALGGAIISKFKPQAGNIITLISVILLGILFIVFFIIFSFGGASMDSGFQSIAELIFFLPYLGIALLVVTIISIVKQRKQDRLKNR